MRCLKRRPWRQDTREQLLSTGVELLGLAVCGMHRSVHAAYQAKKERVGVSITALYDKLDHVEPDVSTALIPYSAQRLGPIVESLQAMLPPELAGSQYAGAGLRCGAGRI